VLVHEWPGRGGILLHLPDPLAPSSDLAPTLDALKRILSVHPRGDAPYQVHVTDIAEFLNQFGFTGVTLVAESLSAVTGLLLATWWPHLVARITLVSPRYLADGESLFARSLRDAPPDWPSIRASIACPID
jgi:pimeloyl-ACP methyl ester carboxylesterase